MKRMTQKQADKLIDATFNRVASGVQIPLMSIPKIFAAGRSALAEGRDLDTAIRDIVAVLRVN